MDPFALPPLASILDLGYAALLGLVHALTPFLGSSAATAAILLLTVAVRTALVPLGVAQAKAEQARSRLAPRLRELQRRYRHDSERLRRETMNLYAKEQISPFAGCLPTLAQAPVVGLLYSLFLRPEIAGHPNALLSETLWSVPLGASPLHAVAGGIIDAAGLTVFGGVLGVIVVVAEISRRVFRVAETSPAASSSLPAALGSLHYLTAVFAVFIPLAAGLYLAVTVSWTLAQRLLLRRRYPLHQAA